MSTLFSYGGLSRLPYRQQAQILQSSEVWENFELSILFGSFHQTLRIHSSRQYRPSGIIRITSTTYNNVDLSIRVDDKSFLSPLNWLP